MATEWTAVRSSNVARVGWDSEAEELLIEFKSGATYAYPSADEAAYQDLITSNSPGQYVNRWLRGQPSRRLS